MVKLIIGGKRRSQKHKKVTYKGDVGNVGIGVVGVVVVLDHE